MGTRGLIILVFKKRVITLYNHFDSYPSGLGQSLIMQIQHLLKTFSIDEIITMIDGLKIVSDAIPPSNEEKVALAKYSDLAVSSQSLDDWYCLLRQCQGSICNVIESGYALADEYDTYEEATNRKYLRCVGIEYFYTIDLNNNTFSCNGEQVCLLTESNTNWIGDSDSDL